MKNLGKSILVFFILMSSYVFADSKSEMTSLANTLLNKLEMPEDSPDWLKRTTFKIHVEENFKPTWEVETVQPIYQFLKSDMFFWQFHAMSRNSVETYNLGLGYRTIINPELMLGINSFYDYQQNKKHKRWSVGLEAIGKKYEIRVNRYLAISKKKEISNNEFEEVLNGWDVEIGGKIIPSSNLRTYISYSVWDAKEVDDLKQRKIRLEYPINDSMNFELGYTKDSEKQGDLEQDRVFAKLIISLGKKNKSSKNLERSINLHDKLLIPVKREHEIIVERTIKAAITIGRGN